MATRDKLSAMDHLQVSADKLSGLRRHYGVTVSFEPHSCRFWLLHRRPDNRLADLKAHKSQITGNPMSHLARAGFNRPEFAIRAWDPQGSSPGSTGGTDHACLPNLVMGMLHWALSL
jgi:hypothetical protein